jgi:hypothetical protein
MEILCRRVAQLSSTSSESPLTRGGGTFMNLRAGELVEVRSKEEILATLDEDGKFEGVPFMPEMLQFCGRRLRVYKSAHKTCDFVTNTGSRRLSNAVHLEGVRCDGSAHGGCQAQCMIFWKTVWLKRVDGGSPLETRPASNQFRICTDRIQSHRCTEPALIAACVAPSSDLAQIYVCQATLLPKFTYQLSPWDVRQYIQDYRSGNISSIRKMMSRFAYRFYDNLINLGIGWGPILRWFYDVVQNARSRTPYPARAGEIPSGSRTPTCTINLRPGDLVRVKSYEEILATLDTSTKNRGMAFSAEMVPYCGGIYRVRSQVTKIIDEKTGKMLHFRNSCVMLEGAACQALYNKSMIFCPRSTYAYWREIWLEPLKQLAEENTRMDNQDCNAAVECSQIKCL